MASPATVPSATPTAMWRRFSGPTLALLLTACATAGPDYVKPTIELPPAYKEAGPQGTAWKPAQPLPAGSQQPWWETYRDTTLSSLITDANRANQSLQVAEAQYRQSQAVADAARAGYFPVLGANAGLSRARTDSNGVRVGNVHSAGLAASWEPDLWGSVRRQVESGQAGVQASADDLAAARLSIQGTLAQTYFQLRITDQLRALYADTVAAYTRSLKLTQAQYAAGTALRSDVALAESQLATAQAAGVDLDASRAQLEHAIAILTGRAPAQFSLPALPPPTADAETSVAALPEPPATLPSELLERRPDIAAAERRVALANANIGVARAAYFPALTLSASGGFSAATLGSLFDTPSRVWSLGAALAQTLFDGGLRHAKDAQAVAAYDGAVAQYKQTVLSGFQQVEDNLATLRVLQQEAGLQDKAVQAARLAERLALSQYRAGTATYLTVLTAQAQSLTNQRTAVQLRGRQFAASVGLVTASGGDWQPDRPNPQTGVPQS